MRGLLAAALTLPVTTGGMQDAPRQVARPAAASSRPASWGPIVTGRLANGLRYAILPRTGGEPGVGLLMRDEGGFIAERRPGERGLAHLIEHLAFVSPTRRAPDDLRHFLRIGLSLTFAAPSAGTTTWRETNYFVSTRTKRPADLDVLLALFREVATDLTFRSDAVDDQCADVMREMAGRRAGNPVYARYIAAVAPGSPTDVIDAQNSDDVPTASVDAIRELYRRLYRPEAVSIVIVGDVDPARTAALVRRQFGGWRAPAPAPVRAPVPRFRGDRIVPISYSDAADGRRVATITVTSPTLAPAPTRRDQADAALLEMLAIRAVNYRLIANQPDAPPGKTGIFIENGEQGHRLVMLWDDFAAATGWRPAIASLSRSACALETDGFGGAEWDRARRDVIGELERRTAGMAATPNVELAKDLSHALADGRSLIPPDDLLRRARILVPGIDAGAGSRWWRRTWRAGVEHVRVESPDLAGTGSPVAAIRAAADGAAPTLACKVRPG